MSADNWTDCPQCKKNAEKRLVERRAELDKQYGQIPADEYIKQRMQLSAMIARRSLFAMGHKQGTLREDWDLGIDGTEIYIHYEARCDECGFSAKYFHREAIKLHHVWIPHDGSDECHVPAGFKAKLKFRDGSTVDPGNPADLRWRHDGNRGDIMEYMITGPIIK